MDYFIINVIEMVFLYLYPFAINNYKNNNYIYNFISNTKYFILYVLQTAKIAIFNYFKIIRFFKNYSLSNFTCDKNKNCNGTNNRLDLIINLIKMKLIYNKILNHIS